MELSRRVIFNFEEAVALMNIKAQSIYFYNHNSVRYHAELIQESSLDDRYEVTMV